MMNNLFDVFKTGHKDTLENNNQNIHKVPLSMDILNVLPLLSEVYHNIKDWPHEYFPHEKKNRIFRPFNQHSQPETDF